MQNQLSAEWRQLCPAPSSDRTHRQFIFVADQAAESGVDPSMAEWILPALGVANAVGRALSGVMCEVPGVSALVLSCITMSIAGIMVAITCLCASPIYQLFVASAYGFFIGK